MIALLTPAAASAHVGYASPDAAAQKKPKKKKCKRTQMRVKVGKRVRCRPVRQAFPKPRAGDARALVARFALTKDWSRFRDRRGTRIPSLPKLIRRTGRNTPALLMRATSRGLDRLDVLGGAPEAALARAAQSGCATGGARQSSSFTSSSGGTSATVGVQLGPEGASLGIELSGNGYTVSVDMDMGLCDPNELEAPECPTAAGRLDGLIRYKLKVAIQVTKGGTDVWSQATDVTRRTKLVGWNEVDAKLGQLDIEDLETSVFTLGGSTRGHPPVTVKTRLERRTQVDMRTGSYDPGQSSADVTILAEGFYGPDRDDAEAEAERKARTDADRQFRAVVEKAIAGYRSREEGWQTPSPAKCAELRLSPVKDSLTLRGGSAGSFTVTAIAKADGAPSELDARLTDTQHAIFEPTRAGGQRAQFGYRDVPSLFAPGSKVRVKVNATSKAGVAEAVWEQPLQPPFEINQIAGNFSGTQTQTLGSRTARITWTGSGTFTRQTPPGVAGAIGTYILTAGSVSIHYSGATITAHAACDMRGSTFVDLFQHGSGSAGVTPVDLSKAFEQGPHTYGASAGIGPDPRVTLTMENCAPGAESEEGKTYDWPPSIQPLETGDAQTSPDGLHYSGSRSVSHPGFAVDWTWVLTGSKVP